MTERGLDLSAWWAALSRNQWSEAEAGIATQLQGSDAALARLLAPASLSWTMPMLIQKGQQAVQAGALASASALFLALAGRFPNEFEPWLNVARVRARQGDWQKAFVAAEAARHVAPDRPEIWQFLLWVGPRAGQTSAQQLARAQQWSQQSPNLVLPWLGIARLQLEAGDYEAVHQAVDRVLALSPKHVSALWLSMLTPDRRNMRDAADQQRFLSRWRACLAQLESLPLEAPAQAAEQLDVVASQPNFYLAYLGEAFRDDLARFGVLMQRMLRPALGRLECTRRRITRTRRRIGIVTRYFPEHSISKLFLPMFLKLDPARFEVIGICPNTYRDAWVARAQQGLSQYLDGEASVAEWAARIAALDCDVLIYPDLGMNAMTHCLAALRLAPVQAMLWGHPISSGLRSMDWYLSSAQMEPPDGDAHYVERLLRLPGLGCGFEPPVFGASQYVLPRTPGRVVALCAQMWAKLRPEHDAVFARLLAAAPHLDLHLTPVASGDGLALLRSRLQQACAKQHVDFAARVTIHPRLTPADFHALQGQVDFLLDSIGWSGGVTAFEGFAQNRPIVTYPGTLMRARHTAAMLERMDLSVLIARNTDDYIAIATQLAEQPEYLQAMQDRIGAVKHVLFEHDQTQNAFSDWLATVLPHAESEHT